MSNISNLGLFFVSERLILEITFCAYLSGPYILTYKNMRLIYLLIIAMCSGSRVVRAGQGTGPASASLMTMFERETRVRAWLAYKNFNRLKTRLPH